jgi:hypothetical protein
VAGVLLATFSAATDDKRCFGDPKARVIKLERRFKERLAAVAVVSRCLVRPQADVVICCVAIRREGPHEVSPLTRPRPSCADPPEPWSSPEAMISSSNNFRSQPGGHRSIRDLLVNERHIKLAEERVRDAPGCEPLPSSAARSAAGKGAEEHNHKTAGRNPDRRGRSSEGESQEGRNIAAEKMAVPICLEPRLWMMAFPAKGSPRLPSSCAATASKSSSIRSIIRLDS